ncbi:hypothetical protein HPB48_013376 [Haemaphysalis longicornis]|uniref:Uncharacterized protein n=1 Tax=Haemaphysalis longicornis TaxID=44386 RepID=A0A9J6FA76_HAELO|nr:hypothetical protein HPB48_013376 [Haemaphysalis longicornis]
MKASTTLWLVPGRVIKMLLKNREELKAYFKCARNEGTQGVKYIARALQYMLNDYVNHFYFLFVSPVLEFEKIDEMVQFIDAAPEKMQKELNMHHRATESQEGKLVLTMADFGARFSRELSRSCNGAESNMNEPLHKI